MIQWGVLMYILLLSSSSLCHVHSWLSQNFLSISSIMTFTCIGTDIDSGLVHNGKCIVLHKLRKFVPTCHHPKSPFSSFELDITRTGWGPPIQPKASQMLEYQYDPSSIDCRVHGVVAGSSALPTPWVAQLECVDAPYQRKKGEEGNNPQSWSARTRWAKDHIPGARRDCLPVRLDMRKRPKSKVKHQIYLSKPRPRWWAQGPKGDGRTWTSWARFEFGSWSLNWSLGLGSLKSPIWTLMRSIYQRDRWWSCELRLGKVPGTEPWKGQ